MSVRTINTLVLSVALMFGIAPFASAAKGEGGPIAKIIKHATELKLTSDQISKLEEVQQEAKGAGKEKGAKKGLMEKVKAILTPEQIEMIKKYREEHKKTK